MPGEGSDRRAADRPAAPRVVRPTGRSSASDTKATFYDYLGMLKRRKWLAIGVFLAVVALTAVYILRTEPVFQARATFMVTEQSPGSVLSDRYAYPLYNDKYVDNCIELLRSRSLAERVAERMPDSLRLSAGALQSMVSARPVRSTDVIELVAAGPSRAAAVAVANAYLETYRQYDLDQSRAEVSATRKFIEDQLAVAGPRLDSFERTLQEFKSSHRLADLDAETKALINQQAAVAAAYQQADAEIQASEAQLAHVQGQIDQA
jgi:uncharacterized protein involved in exopolysaccharide biosynthesis